MNMEHQPNMRRTGAFTLIELLVTISIIAILAGIVIGISGVATKKSDASKARAEITRIQNALEEYRMQYGNYPTNSAPNDITSLGNSVLNRLTNTMDNAVRDLKLIDPWGNGYWYENQNRFRAIVYSKGPDGREDTGDDISLTTGSY